MNQPFKWVLYCNGVPHMGCEMRGPLISYLYQPGPWVPDMPRDEFESKLHESPSVKTTLRAGNHTTVWEIRYEGKKT